MNISLIRLCGEDAGIPPGREKVQQRPCYGDRPVLAAVGDEHGVSDGDARQVERGVAHVDGHDPERAGTRRREEPDERDQDVLPRPRGPVQHE